MKHEFVTDNAFIAAQADRAGECIALEQCARSGQMDSKQIAAHVDAGELRLQQRNGGERVNTAHDEPPISCDQAQRLPVYLVVAVVLAALGAAASIVF